MVLDFDRLRELRARQPEFIGTALRGRSRRSFLRGDGRLLIIAADHTARGIIAVGQNAHAMGDRCDLLERLVTALARPGVDGVLGTADVIDDLSALGVLDDKIVIASINRGGLASSTFEVDDRSTGYQVADAVESGLDAGKLLLRIDLDDGRSADMLERAALTISEAARAKMPILIEPFLCGVDHGRLKNDLSPDGMIRAIAIASALGGDSRYSWLKLPVVPDMERVMRATTLPTLLLGGDISRDPGETHRLWESALALPGVRGLAVGRSLLYPHDGDVAASVDIASALVHDTSATSRSR